MATVNEKMTAIADAIREKTGETTPMTLDNMTIAIPVVYTKGNDEGYAQGMEVGEEWGYQAGFQDGFLEGDANGYGQGYDEGKYQGVIEGKQAKHNEFWNSYQSSKRFAYRYANSGWNDVTFQPVKSDIVTGAAQSMFRWSYIPNIKSAYRDRGLELDFSKCTNMQLCFSSALTTEIGIIDMSSNIETYGANECFAYNPRLVIIEKIISNRNTYWGASFASCNNLQEVIFEGEIGRNGLSFSDSPKLTHESLMSVINCLVDYSGTTATYTVTLGSINLEKLTDAEKAIATQKGWTLA